MHRSPIQTSFFVGILGAALSLGVGCKKNEGSPPVAGAVENPLENAEAAEAGNEDEAAKKAEQAKRAQDALERLKTEIPEEAARWTDELKASSKALATKDFKTPEAAIKAALASGHRMPGHSERDAARHPQETLLFFGITPSAKVVEMGSGGGWYTELLAPIVSKKGSLTIGTHDATGPETEMRTVYGRRQQAFLAKSEDLYGKIKTFSLASPESVSLGAPGSADLVLAMREMHGWQRRDQFDLFVKAVVDVLAPGGVFGVVQHRAKADAKVEESAEKGYLPEAWVIEKLEAAGLKLEDKSEINANAKDTKDYEKGVWTLPPSLRLKDVDKEKYTAIGESDRMTLRFVKPKSQ